MKPFRPYNQGIWPWVMRIDPEVAFHADVHELPSTQAGRKTLTLNARVAHANRSYWILGTLSGVSPGLTQLRAQTPRAIG